MLEAKFQMHPIGQGLFYSGIVDSMRFVYDIGSASERLITAYIKDRFLPSLNGRLELLVLSHLHNDHVSGLPALKSVSIDNVVLPYLFPYERLVLATQYIAFSRRKNVDWYLRFLSSPAGFLREEMNVEQVIFIGGGTGWGERMPTDEGWPPGGGRGGSIYPSDKNLGCFPREDDIGEDGEENIRPLKFPEHFENNEHDSLSVHLTPLTEEIKEHLLKFEDEKLKSLSNVMLNSYDGYIVWKMKKYKWLFAFFNHFAPLQQLVAFRHCVQSQFHTVSPAQIMQKLIDDSSSLEKLRKCYSDKLNNSLQNFNNSSLIMYHGEIHNCECEVKIEETEVGVEKVEVEVDPWCGGHPDCCYEHDKVPCVGHLLTGDVDLNFQYDDIKRHFGSWLQNIYFVQVPHHGAIGNWNASILQDAPHARIWGVSAGIRYKKHPDASVGIDIKLAERCPYWVNENYSLLLYYDCA